MFPKVSIIVPNYNHAPFLKQRLDSIFNQTFQDFEVIILDDCSTDNSKEIIEQYRSNPKVSHVIYNEKNSGSPFKQWAKGFELARGEYIWIAESDDWAEQDFLKKLVLPLNNPSTYIAFSNSTIVYPDKAEIDIKGIKSDEIYDGIDFIKNKMCSSNYILNASSVLFKKKVLSKISTKYASFKSSGDWQFWIEICSLGDVFFTPQKLNFNNRHGKNTTAMWGKLMSSGTAFFEYRQIFHYLKKKKYIPFFQAQSAVINKLEHIDHEKEHFDTYQIYQLVRKDWKNEILSETLSKVYIRIIIFSYKLLKFFFR